MFYFKFLISAIFFTVSASVLQADIIHVPADYERIQVAIYFSEDGDTVLVADGIYTGLGNRDIDFLGRAIVVMSENGPENCIIDCEGSVSNNHRGFFFHRGEDSSSIVKGFAIRNGIITGGSNQGGAILCIGSSPTIEGNIITGNQADFGGGIKCEQNSSPIITGNTITGNTALWGGGIYCYRYSSPIITGNNITSNTASYGGGGVYCYWHCSPTISDNKINGNESIYGGGIWCDFSSPTITDNTIVENIAGVGGGISCWDSSPTITGNTIAGNSASFGVGIWCQGSAYPTITNTIFWNDSLQEITSFGGQPVVTYSDVQGGWEGEGNIDEDPMFVLPDKHDYRLLWDSPCIDAGHPDSTDADGTRSDMGSHFFNQGNYITLYLTPDQQWVKQGEQLGVTYTTINRWDQPESFWALSQVILPGGSAMDVLGPAQFTLPADYTAQVYVTHNVPMVAPAGEYEYWSRIGVLPPELYDEDSFKFYVIE